MVKKSSKPVLYPITSDYDDSITDRWVLEDLVLDSTTWDGLVWVWVEITEGEGKEVVRSVSAIHLQEIEDQASLGAASGWGRWDGFTKT